MNLLAWLTGAWKAGSWKAGAWEGDEAPPDYLPSGGVFKPRRLKDPRKKREDEELLLFFN